MQSTDKFKAGATTLEVIRHPEKYISAKYSKRLSDLELEGLISPATGSGSFRFDATKGHFWAKTRIDIFDHFGLDKSDIEKFGSLENVRDKAVPWGKILSEATRPRDDQGVALTKYGASDVLFEEAAEGFCSWFILQYRRGYKPFVTMMRKEVKIEGGPMTLKNKLPAVLVLGLLSLSIIHFKNDIVLPDGDAYVLNSYLDINDGDSVRSEVRLVRDAPYLQGNISKFVEHMFWSSILLKEARMCKVVDISFYRETEFLNQRFEEGKEYSPAFDPMDNVMDWRNHFEDRLGDVMYWKREDGSVDYYVKTYSSALGVRCLVDITSHQQKVQTYNSIDELFYCKCLEFDILKQ